jgi:hypothetical protein
MVLARLLGDEGWSLYGRTKGEGITAVGNCLLKILWVIRQLEVHWEMVVTDRFLEILYMSWHLQDHSWRWRN